MSEKEFCEAVIKLLLSKEEIKKCNPEKGEDYLFNAWGIISDRYNYLISERKMKEDLKEFRKKIFRKIREAIKKEE